MSENPSGSAGPKLLDQVRGKIRLKHYSIRTEQAYVDWIKRFILFFDKRHPKELGGAEVEAFLTHLAVEGNTENSGQTTVFPQSPPNDRGRSCHAASPRPATSSAASAAMPSAAGEVRNEHHPSAIKRERRRTRVQSAKCAAVSSSSGAWLPSPGRPARWNAGWLCARCGSSSPCGG